MTIGEEIIPEFLSQSISLSPSKRPQVQRQDSPRPRAPYSPRLGASYSPGARHSPRPSTSTSLAADASSNELESLHLETARVFSSATNNMVHNYPSVSRSPDEPSFQRFLNDPSYNMDYFGQPYTDSQGTAHGRFDDEEPEQRQDRARKRLF